MWTDICTIVIPTVLGIILICGLIGYIGYLIDIRNGYQQGGTDPGKDNKPNSMLSGIFGMAKQLGKQAVKKAKKVAKAIDKGAKVVTGTINKGVEAINGLTNTADNLVNSDKK